MRRPTGVTILAVLQLIYGLLGTLVSAIALFFGGLIAAGGAVSGDAQTAGVGGALIIITIISLVLSILALIVSFGLFNLEAWAWTLTYVLQAISLVVYVVDLFMGENVGGAIFSIVISAEIIYYLNRPNVKSAFDQA